MIRKVAILANGGDVSGFNAVIRAIVKTAENNGIDCYGFIDGYNGLLKNNYEKLSTANDEHASGILQKGGSIIGSSTNANVFHYKVEENGETVYKDLSDVCVENIKKDGFDCLFTLGGDGTQKSARDFSTKGINVIGVPKEIACLITKEDLEQIDLSEVKQAVIIPGRAFVHQLDAERILSADGEERIVGRGPDTLTIDGELSFDKTDENVIEEELTQFNDLVDAINFFGMRI